MPLPPQVQAAPRWTLTQTNPGSFTWTTPGGRAYRTAPAEYCA
jgi:hypothetical protein